MKQRLLCNWLFVFLILLDLPVYIQAQDSTRWKADVPKTWDEAELADWATPLASRCVNGGSLEKDFATKNESPIGDEVDVHQSGERTANPSADSMAQISGVTGIPSNESFGKGVLSKDPEPNPPSD